MGIICVNVHGFGKVHLIACCFFKGSDVVTSIVRNQFIMGWLHPVFASFFHLFVSTSIIVVIDEYSALLYSNVGVEGMVILLFVDFSSHFGNPEANRTRFTEDAFRQSTTVTYLQIKACFSYTLYFCWLFIHRRTYYVVYSSCFSTKRIAVISRSAVSSDKIPLSWVNSPLAHPACLVRQLLDVLVCTSLGIALVTQAPWHGSTFSPSHPSGELMLCLCYRQGGFTPE